MRRTGAGNSTTVRAAVLGSFMVVMSAWMTAGMTACMSEAASPGTDRDSAQTEGAQASVKKTRSAPPASAPTVQERDRFRDLLKEKFDASRVSRRQDVPGGPVFYKPNGHVAHAVVAVRNADGTISRQCISTPAEVDALMNKANPSGQAGAR